MSQVTQHRTQIYLPRSLYMIVKQLAQARGTSIAQVVRSAIESYTLPTKKAKRTGKTKDGLLELAGIFRGPKDLAKGHDKYWDD